MSVERNNKSQASTANTSCWLAVAPGRRAANVQLGRQRVNTMAGRGRNQPQPQPLQGADPALV